MKGSWAGKGGGKGANLLGNGNILGVLNALLKQNMGTQTQSLGVTKTATPKDTGGGVLGEVLGTITKVGPKFGFIECPEVAAMGGTSNVFILADELKQYQVGHKVRFTAYFDSQGRLQGKDLKSGLKGPGAIAAKPMNVWNQSSGNQSWGNPVGNIPKAKDASGGEFGQFLGTITKTGPKFGFIECPDLTSMGQSSNVFILADELRQYQVGHKVKFTAYLDGKGRLQGKDLKSGLK